jgi:hypothetical protein
MLLHLMSIILALLLAGTCWAETLIIRAGGSGDVTDGGMTSGVLPRFDGTDLVDSLIADDAVNDAYLTPTGTGTTTFTLYDRADRVTNYQALRASVVDGTATLACLEGGTGSDNCTINVNTLGTGIVNFVVPSPADVAIRAGDGTRWVGMGATSGATWLITNNSHVFNIGTGGNGSMGIFPGAPGGITIGGAGMVDPGSGNLVSNSNTGLGFNGVPNATLSIGNKTEGGTWQLNKHTVRSLHTLAAANTSDTTDVSIPAGARLIGCSTNVNTAVTTSAAGNTWAAAFITGSTVAIVPATEPGTLNTKEDTQFDGAFSANPLTTATTEIRYTAVGAETFTAGAIEAVCIYETLTSMANA